MFELAGPKAVEFKSPRACAFALLGLQEYLDSFPGDRAALSASDALANRLLNSYRSNRSDDWKWFENGLAYSNAFFPQALMRAGLRAEDEEMVSACHGPLWLPVIITGLRDKVILPFCRVLGFSLNTFQYAPVLPHP